MDTYTPRSRAGPRKKPIGLSQKEYTKITGTIASVRRNRMPSSSNDLDDAADGMKEPQDSVAVRVDV